MNEVWKDISIGKFGQIYEVSNLGRLRSKITGTVYKPGNVHGYLRFKLVARGCIKGMEEEITVAVHRIVALAFIGESPEGKDQINHKNCDKLDNRIENLEWVSNDENREHAQKHGIWYTDERKATMKKFWKENRESIIQKMKEGWKNSGRTNKAERARLEKERLAEVIKYAFAWQYKNR